MCEILTANMGDSSVLPLDIPPLLSASSTVHAIDLSTPTTIEAIIVKVGPNLRALLLRRYESVPRDPKYVFTTFLVF